MFLGNAKNSIQLPLANFGMFVLILCRPKDNEIIEVEFKWWIDFNFKVVRIYKSNCFDLMFYNQKFMFKLW